jgi:hypothetical protein
MYPCQNCGATINKLLICDRCGTKRCGKARRERLAAAVPRYTRPVWPSLAQNDWKAFSSLYLSRGTGTLTKW